MTDSQTLTNKTAKRLRHGLIFYVRFFLTLFYGYRGYAAVRKVPARYTENKAYYRSYDVATSSRFAPKTDQLDLD